MKATTRWRTALWALLIVLPGGLWVLGLFALVNALRRALRPAVVEALPPSGSHHEPPSLDPTVSTWF